MGEAGARLKLEIEPEVVAVEGDCRVDILDYLTNTNGNHRFSSSCIKSFRLCAVSQIALSTGQITSNHRLAIGNQSVGLGQTRASGGQRMRSAGGEL